MAEISQPRASHSPSTNRPFPTNQPMAGRLRILKPPTEEDKVRKREKNTAAARKYRHKRTSRINELEQALSEMTKERDELKMHLLASQAEARTLKDIQSRRDRQM